MYIIKESERRRNLSIKVTARPSRESKAHVKILTGARATAMLHIVITDFAGFRIQVVIRCLTQADVIAKLSFRTKDPAEALLFIVKTEHAYGNGKGVSATASVMTKSTVEVLALKRTPVTNSRQLST